MRYQPGWLQTGILTLTQEADALLKVAAAQNQANRQLQNNVFWVLIGTGKREEALAEATNKLVARLRDNAAITGLKYRWLDDAGYEEEWSLLFPLRQQLLTFRDRDLIEKQPEQVVKNRLALLYSPQSAGLNLEQDPFGTFRHYFIGKQELRARIYNGIPVQVQGDRAFSIVQSTVAAVELGGNIQTPLLVLREQLQSWAEKRDLRLLAVGAPLHTEYAAASAQQEIRLIGMLSIVSICVLSLLVFRSVRPLLLTLFAIGCGITSGLAAVIALLGQMHILAFVFGTTVSGLAVDYAYHYICNRMRPGVASDADVLPGLLLGLVSSCLSFFVLALSPFPLLRQIGVFVGAGLIGAWLTVILLFPAFLKLHTKELTIAEKMPQLRVPYYPLLLALILTIGVAAFPSIEFGDDLQLFYQPPEFLVADETELDDLFPDRPESFYFLVQGKGWRQLLEREWKLVRELEGLKAEGILENFRALSVRFPPLRVQQGDWVLNQNFYKSATVRGFYTQLGYSATDAERLTAALQEPFQTITLSDWISVAGEQYKELWLGCEEDNCASIVKLYGLKRYQALPESITGVVLIDPARKVAAVMSQQRDLIIRLIPLVIILVFLLTALSIGMRRALRIVSLPVAVVVTTLALIVLSGVAINLFHVAALLLVFGIGIDYAVFSQMTKSLERNYTMLAIGMAGVTTLLGFGLLSLSATPAITEFGRTLAVGIILTLVLVLLFFSKAVESDNQ
ncbi:MMPL family transporter [Microbulbifer discodermiae]|uniref:MMPL family transporter n=1 Tax=Microbulbifer sp. 2201CG32-9 TaxID=3232309 RepID=UPI00345B97E2